MADAVPPHEAAFEAQFDYMVDSIDAGSLAPACLAAGLINDRQRDECFRESSAFKKAELLLGHVKRSIKGDRTKFDTFVAILRRTGHKTQADKLTQNVTSKQSSGGGATVTQPGTSQVSVSAGSAGDETLEIEDLKDVIEYVFELNMTQFKQLGLQLGLIQPTLDKLTDGTKPDEYGTKVMTEWLNQVDKAQPTWNNLAKALDKKTVKAHVQAAQIREDLKNGTLN